MFHLLPYCCLQYVLHQTFQIPPPNLRHNYQVTLRMVKNRIVQFYRSKLMIKAQQIKSAGKTAKAVAMLRLFAILNSNSRSIVVENWSSLETANRRRIYRGSCTMVWYRNMYILHSAGQVSSGMQNALPTPGTGCKSVFGFCRL